MIYGIGTDLCEVARIEKSMARESFLTAVFSAEERALIESRSNKARAETAAANFAAKEAFVKACGTGLHGVALRDIAALRQPGGAPYYRLTGTAAELMRQHHLKAYLSLTHEAGLAGAFAVLERET